MSKIINKILRFLKLFFFGFKKFYRKYGKDITSFIHKLKVAVESDEAEAIVAFTKTNLDDKLLLFLRRAFSTLYYEIPSSDNTFEQILVRYITQLKEAPPMMRRAIYFKLASLIFKNICPENIKDSEADTFIQLSYKMNKENKM